MDIQRAYEAMGGLWLGSERTAQAFEQAAHSLDAHMFHMTDLSHPELSLIGGRISKASCADYVARYAYDTWTLTAKAARQGDERPVYDHDILPADHRRGDPYYQEFCADWDIVAHAAWTIELGGAPWALCIMRNSRQGDFTQSDRELLEAFAPQSRHFALMGQTLRAAADGGYADGLAMSGHPVILLDHNGDVQCVTPAAEPYLSGAISVRERALHAADLNADAALHRLRAMLRARRAPLCVETIVVPRGEKRPLILSVMAIRRPDLDLLPGVRVAIRISDPERPRALSIQSLRSLFGLTDTEAVVAAKLAQGQAIGAIAVSLGLRESSVRQVVKSLLAKTETHRQAELIALLSRLPEG